MNYSQQLQVIVEDAREAIRLSTSKADYRPGFIIEDVTRPGKERFTNDVRELLWLADNPSIVQLADDLEAMRGISEGGFVGRYRRLILEIVTDIIRRLDLHGPFKLSAQQLAEANDPTRTDYSSYPIYTLPETGPGRIVIRRAGLAGNDVRINGRLLGNEPYLDLCHSIRKLVDTDLVRFAGLL